MEHDGGDDRYKLGCDIGGTFTDFLLLDRASGEMLVEKCLTTPSDPSAGVFNGIERLAKARPGFLGSTEAILHATTLVINAVIERKGAKTALITTRGFRDVLEIGREMRYDIYDLSLAYPKPLVPRYLRRGVTERTYHDGSVQTPLDVADFDRLIRELQGQAVESLAICFLHSYANPANEQAALSRLASLAPDMPVSLSSSVLPEIREYERTSTTVVNAYAKPLIARYVTRLMAGLQTLGFERQLLIMLSSGGMTTTDTAKEFPVRIIESGPAAGSMAAVSVGGLAGISELIAFDMGGTTAKGCVIRNGVVEKTSASEVAREHRFKRGSGIPVNVPFVDLVEIGAGGGSIAHIDELGLMRVGPESAGASPGPACYGLGGVEPTVSDADLVLGYLNADYFLGGSMRLDESAARSAIEERLGKRLGVTVERAAAGIHQIVTENMGVAIRIHMADKGVDPTKFTLLAFGGAGPIHAWSLARRLGISKVLIPPVAGIASAFGLLVSPLSFDQVQTYRSKLTQVDLSRMEATFQRMEAAAAASITQAEGVEDIAFSRSLDLCYAGQNDTVNVALATREPIKTIEAIQLAFEGAYRRLYSRVYRDIDVNLVNLRVVAQSSKTPLQLKEYPVGDERTVAAKTRRSAYCPLQDRYVEHAVYDRYSLSPGARIRGPAIVEERESTTILGSDAEALVDRYKILVITLRTTG